MALVVNGTTIKKLIVNGTTCKTGIANGVTVFKAWNGELFLNGDEFEDVTGGWVNDGFTSLTNSGTQLICDATGLERYSYGWAKTANLIDLTDYSKLTLSGSLQTYSNNSCHVFFRIYDANGNQVHQTLNTYSGYPSVTLEGDISSLKGLHQICISTSDRSRAGATKLFVDSFLMT